MKPTISSWCGIAFLGMGCVAGATAASPDTPHHAPPAVSHVGIQIPIPLAPLAGLYAGLHQPGSASRPDGREWVSLGGGTGFLKYRLWPGDHAATIAENRLSSQASVPFGVEYAKQVNGTITPIAECGQRATAAGAGQLFVQYATGFTQGRNYTLVPSSTITAVDPKQPCLLSTQGVDAAPLMARIYRSDLQLQLQATDRKAGALGNMKPAMSRVWADFQEPLLLNKDQALWLLLNPESVGTGGITTVSDNLAATFGITARPTVVRGSKSSTRSLSLPDPQDRWRDEGFHVSFPVEVPIEEANQRLRETVVGRQWSLGIGVIKVTDATLYPVGSQLGVELVLRGLLPLTVHLQGTPIYDEARGDIVFRDFNYRLAERTPATDLAEEWLHDFLRDELAGRLAIPIRDELDLMRQALEEGLNRDLSGGHLQGTVQTLSLEEVAVQAKMLSIRFKTDGSLRYVVHANAIAP
ncbi:MAG: DUF4403 family protein [Nitrospira sp.]|nr:DUF4403 family protein [Nitrospira sp.]QOJ36968.1 MAG: DUF4403 family protein [Nitrospira sp.]